MILTKCFESFEGTPRFKNMDFNSNKRSQVGVKEKNDTGSLLVAAFPEKVKNRSVLDLKKC